MTIPKRIGHVLSSSPGSIVVEVDDLKTFEEHKRDLQIGRYLKIAQGNNDFTVAVVLNLTGDNRKPEITSAVQNWRFQVECQPIGGLNSEGRFERGTILLPVPTEPVYVADDSTLASLFVSNEEYNLPFGHVSINKKVAFHINGDKFFGKHIAVVGSTGSGKSCAVAKVLQDAVGINDCKNRHAAAQQNSHIVIFDLHSEYVSAFSLEKKEKFTLNLLNIDTLKLPYWLMNSEELECIFIESNEQNSHNQVSQFKQAVILNKEKHNPHIKEVTYDAPIYFSIHEVYRYIDNMNREVIGRLDGENAPKLANGTLVKDRAKHYFDASHDFVAQSTSGAAKATNGPFYGEFNRFVSRLEAKLADKRLKFLLDAKKPDGKSYMTPDFEEIMKQFLGYLTKSNITIVDISGVPFEVLSITVSLISRLIFDFCFHYSKLRHENGQLNDIPFIVVCEEAHNYVPQREDAAYRPSRKSIERIAKEGRKYGLGLMVVSQRPSEVSETIFAQCNNFIALRLTNSSDQNYVKRLFPDNTSGITEVLPNLADGECIIVGDAVLLPAVVQLDLPNPEPKSQTVKVYKEWQQDWKDVLFGDVVKRWRKE